MAADNIHDIPVLYSDYTAWQGVDLCSEMDCHMDPTPGNNGGRLYAYVLAQTEEADELWTCIWCYWENNFAFL